MVTRAARVRAAERAEKLAGIHSSYCERHPAKAREERQFRKEQASLAREHEKRDRLRDRGTPETAAHARRVRQGSLARLYEKGQITADQLAAAQEIRQVAERITSDVRIGTFSLETRVDNDRRHGGAFFERLRAVRAEVAYTRWREALGKRRDAVLAMVVGEMSVSAAASRYRMRKETARKLLSRALDDWSDCMRATVNEIDEADMLAAHAGLV